MWRQWGQTLDLSPSAERLQPSTVPLKRDCLQRGFMRKVIRNTITQKENLWKKLVLLPVWIDPKHPPRTPYIVFKQVDHQTKADFKICVQRLREERWGRTQVPSQPPTPSTSLWRYRWQWQRPLPSVVIKVKIGKRSSVEIAAKVPFPDLFKYGWMINTMPNHTVPPARSSTQDCT